MGKKEDILLVLMRGMGVKRGHFLGGSYLQDKPLGGGGMLGGGKIRILPPGGERGGRGERGDATKVIAAEIWG